MLKWTHFSEKEDAKAVAILKKLNCEHGNAFPSNWREITPLEFARSKFGTYTPDFEDYRQMIPEKDEKRTDFLTFNSYRKKWEPVCLGCRVYFYWDGTGVAIHTSYYNEEKPVRYFAFGCQHDYREMSTVECHNRNIYHAGRCYHVSECRKCNHVFACDSSD